MGAELRCVARSGGRSAEGRALLETDELLFRSQALKLKIPLKSVTTVRAEGGRLELVYAGGEAVLELGTAAEKWAEKIRAPKSVGEKLGVKPGARVVLAGVEVPGLRAVLAERGATVVEAQRGADAAFVGVASAAELGLIAIARAWIEPSGAVWALRPKGSSAVSERDVLAAGKSAGLTDVKVVRFSETHTAEKFVVPVAKR